MSRQPGPARDQTGVRMERRLVKVLKAVAELRDLSLGELLEELVQDAFSGRQYFEESTLPSIRELARIYGLDHADLSPAVLAAPAQGGE